MFSRREWPPVVEKYLAGEQVSLDGQQKSTILDVYLEQRPALLRFLIARFRNETIAEDILQEMYLKLERAEISAPVSNVPAFLYKVANNLALDFRKKRLRRETRDKDWEDSRSVNSYSEPVPDVADPDTAFDAKRRLERVIAAEQELPPQCRRVFILHKFKELSYREVAERLGVSKGTVEKHMSKALKHLVHHAQDSD